MLKLDGVKVLLDAFCSSVGPYLATPESVRHQLLEDSADLAAFTHAHEDHFDPALVSQYRKQTLRPVLGPENLPYGTTVRGVAVGGVSVQPVKSRHIGKEYFYVPHVSYVIRGSKTVWFLGDAVPSQWHDIQDHADVMIAPFAYALSESAWKLACRLADMIVLVHMPLRDEDPAGLWPQVERITAGADRNKLWIPDMGEIISILD